MAEVETDGLSVLAEQFSVREIAKLIAKTARWVDRETFRQMPVWYPEHARRRPLYKANWTTPQTNTNRSTQLTTDKFEPNIRANAALTAALGTTKQRRANWTCCHIWDHGDTKFQRANFVVGDPRFYSCLANMVLLPTPLKAFTDSMPAIKEMLRIVAFHYFGWHCEHEDLPEWTYLSKRTLPEGYPDDWPNWQTPKMPPPGVVGLNPSIARRIATRKKKLNNDIESAGPFFPRDSVAEVMDYWNKKLGVNAYG